MEERRLEGQSTRRRYIDRTLAENFITSLGDTVPARFFEM